MNLKIKLEDFVRATEFVVQHFNVSGGSWRELMSTVANIFNFGLRCDYFFQY